MYVCPRRAQESHRSKRSLLRNFSQGGEHKLVACGLLVQQHRDWLADASEDDSNSRVSSGRRERRRIAPPAARRQLATDALASSHLAGGRKLNSPDSSRARNCSESKRGRVSGTPTNDDRNVGSGVACGRSSTERSAGCGVSWRSIGMAQWVLSMRRLASRVSNREKLPG